ncbi:MAG TPA: glycosyltransferase [Kiritimatiellia bacterium]|nr:glycosyltransferase [Kiritimatiellia bacterium]HMO99120.1 glycosyltransferase [Kiritimatiellia bacterium]HMP95702.1 glycosyltransferase [Kiritimatiellia bacterium]
MEQKRVLFISPQPFLQWRGSPIRVKFNLLALTAAGYQVDLLALPVGEDVAIDGLTIHRAPNPFRVKHVPIGPNGWKLFFDVFLFFMGLRLCLKHRYTVIHGVEEAGFIATLLGGIFRTASIFEKHSDPASYKAGVLKNLVLRAYAQVERITARRANAVIGTGPGLARQVEAMGRHAPVFNIPDIPSSIEEPTESDRETIRAAWHVGPDHVVALYVGSFAIYQGVELLFASIPLAIRQAPDVRFVIIGGAASEIAAYRAELERQGVADQVLFAGTIAPDRLPSFLAAADILLSTRISGLNSPLKLLDYLKTGRAIAATDVPANHTILTGETAVFAPPTPDAYAGLIVDLTRDANHRHQLGAAGRRIYEDNYTFRHHQERLRACYEAAIHHHSRT